MKRIFLIVFVFAGLIFFAPINKAWSSVETLLFQRAGYFIQMEVWQSDLLHFRTGTYQHPPSPIWTTPSILLERRDPGVQYTRSVNGQGEDVIETDEMLVVIAKDQACWTVADKKYHQKNLSRFCVSKNGSGKLMIQMDPMGMKQVFGLGQQLDDPRTDGSLGDDWVGRRRESPSAYGNVMKNFHGGQVGDTQIPVLYALGDGLAGFGLYFDSLTKLSFDFRSQPWLVESAQNEISGFFFNGPDLQDWRRDYLALTGKPLVPPRKMFGLWVSEYGYDNWEELESKLQSLRAKDFPLDGFVMDLQWFGGVNSNSEKTPMGGLRWDETHFPQPAKKIAELYNDKKVGLILIEESYIGKGLPEHQTLSEKQLLAKDCYNCGPSYIDSNPWWGKGGMMDWSNPEARSYWAENKRKALVDMGVMGHWTDLGEPEMFQPNSWYYGFPQLGFHGHGSIHNYFSFFWHQGIVDGYYQFHPQNRPFILSRSSAAGSQRLGVGMWSADIGSNMQSLAAHLRAQMHMSLSGFDYYGSDIGGFHRGGLDGDLNTLYTQWFANASFLDIPVRPHTENLCNCKETAPDRIGHEASNRANLQLRYQLAPYYYSLAHMAHETGDPILPPMFYYFQRDPLARGMAHQKMIGPFLMMGIVASYSQSSRQVYLPEGNWYEYYTNNKIKSAGGWVESSPFWSSGLFRLPLYVREGAVLPMMDSKARDLGDGSGVATVLKIYPSSKGGEFTLSEDDGKSTGYLRGEVKKISLTHGPEKDGTSGHQDYKVTISSSQGEFPGMATERAWNISIVNRNPPSQVLWNGRELKQADSAEKLSARSPSWFQDSAQGVLFVSTPKTGDSMDKQLKISYD